MIRSYLGVLTVLVSSVSISQASELSFKSENFGTLIEKRSGHGSALLPDGKILILGGFSNDENWERWETYDLSTKQSDLSEDDWGIHNHAMVTLPDGRIFLFGGYAGTAQSPAIVRFDPAKVVGTMMEYRSQLTSTAMGNGKVITAGGYTQSFSFTVLSSVEQFDPQTGKSEALGKMLEARAGHSAVALPDGRLLILGGMNGGSRTPHFLSSIEVFDPKTRQSKKVGDLKEPRYGLTAHLLLDGRVLIIGGQSENKRYSSVSVLDLNTFSEQKIGELKTPRFRHTSLQLSDGRIVVIGGRSSVERLSNGTLREVPEESLNSIEMISLN